MLSRPTAIGKTPELTSKEDVDAALHELSWLTMAQRTIEAPAKAKAEELKRETQAKLVVDVAGERMPIKDRWEALQNAVFAWCDKCLRKALPAGKKSLKLSHGEIKSRSLVASVAMLEGKKPDEAAREIAAQSGLIEALEAAAETKLCGVLVTDLVAIKFELNKEGIKSRWERPEVREFLQSLAISVEAGQEQYTIVPADLQMTADG